ncbi:MAG: nitroreductase family protein [Planctomycetota bacterium]|jgi:nitroreductase|nr:nitroreductase family protein [Planctomycetota bacterium]
MKYAPIAVLACLAIGVRCAAFAGDITLPAPQKSGGPALFDAIDARGSAGQAGFPSGRLDTQDLSTILWSASGSNRNGEKWTVPMGMGRAPYCKVYVTTADGVYLYDWMTHVLRWVSSENVLKDIPMQDFAKDAPAVLYVIADNPSLADLRQPDLAAEWCGVLAGAMSQNIYLACEGVNVGTRLIYSINRDEAAKRFKLAQGEVPLFAMPMGKK